MYSFKIIQNWTRDLFPSTIITFEKQAYLFNCSDGTQRNACEQNIRFNKINNVFYNSSSVDAVIGTFGFYLSRNDQVYSQIVQKSLNVAAVNDLSENKKKGKGKNESIAGSSGSIGIGVNASAHPDVSVPSEDLTNNLELKKTFKKPKLDEHADKKLHLWGPPTFKMNFHKIGGFFVEGIADYIHEIESTTHTFYTNKRKEDKFFEDENLKIYPVLTYSSDPNILEKHKHALSFICEPQQKKPKFNQESAIKLGLKPGPHYTDLQNGKSVFLGDKEIKPSDVLDKPSASQCLMILFSPTIHHALSLTESPMFNQYFSTNIDSQNREVSNIIHILGDETILSNDRYQKFMRLFGPDVIHIIDSPNFNSKFMLNEGKNRIKYILNQVNRELFDLTSSTDESCKPLISLESIKEECLSSMKVIGSFSGFEFCLFPKIRRGVMKEKLFQPFYYSSTDFLDFKDKVDKVISEQSDEIKAFENSLNQNVVTSYKNEPEVVFLGTVSMKPGVYRNVSSIMLRLPNSFNLILDCGEGTFSQLSSQYGYEGKLDEVLIKIKVIFITHKHGDHMFGVMKLLLEIDQLKRKINSKEDDKIFVIVPKTVIEWLRKSIETDLVRKNDIVLIDCQDINPSQGLVYAKYITQSNPLANFRDISLEDSSVVEERVNFFLKTPMKHEIVEFYKFSYETLNVHLFSIEVFHCNDSYGCYLEEAKEKSWKISYTGDTRPCNNFQNYSAKSTLIIHEATLEDNLIQDAKEKLHSTFSEGINIGQQNLSKYICLTHFSPRYVKYTPWEPIHNEQKILFTHDFLTFKLSQLNNVYGYSNIFIPIIKKLEDQELI